MYYKLYIDSVFILQMTTDLYLLSLAGQIMRRTATRRKLWLGAAVGAGMGCLCLMSQTSARCCACQCVFDVSHLSDTRCAQPS